MKLIVFWKDKDASNKKYSFIEYAYDSYFGNFGRTRQTLWGGRTDASPKLLLYDT